MKTLLYFNCKYQKYNSDKVERVQRRAARFVISRYSRYSSVSDMLDVLAWTPLSQRRQEVDLFSYTKLLTVWHKCPLKASLLRRMRVLEENTNAAQYRRKNAAQYRRKKCSPISEKKCSPVSEKSDWTCDACSVPQSQQSPPPTRYPAPAPPTKQISDDSTFNVLQLNANGIGNKLTELERNEVKVAVIQESKLSPKSKDP